MVFRILYQSIGPLRSVHAWTKNKFNHQHRHLTSKSGAMTVFKSTSRTTALEMLKPKIPGHQTPKPIDYLHNIDNLMEDSKRIIQP